MKILTAVNAPGVQRAGGLVEFNRDLSISKWGEEVRSRYATIKVGGTPLAAEIAASKWVVSCDVCRDCNPSDPDQPGLPYLCPNCLNVRNGGLARHILYPTNRKSIEAVLILRANPATRNWRPGETVEQLIEENRQHGDPVPEE